MSRTQVLTIGVDKVTMQEAVERCLGFMAGETPRMVVTPNAEFAYAAYHNSAFAEVINQADLVIADGSGVVLATKLLGDPVPEKVPGAELVPNLLQAMPGRGFSRVYLLGAKPESVAEAARQIALKYPSVQVAGYRDGYFTEDEEPEVVADIAKTKPDLLVVGLGGGKQEFFIRRHLHELGAKVAIGAGGTIDMFAGVSPRAPEWAIRTHTEWLWRIVKFGRYGRSLPPLAKFVLLVLGRKLRG